MLLNYNSPFIGEPEGLKIHLMKHQKIMLFKCLLIEKDKRKRKDILSKGFSYGFIASGTGSGKTAVIMSIILTDRIIFKKKTKSIIVVPSIILKQWESEIERFSDLKFKSITTYHDALISNSFEEEILLVSELLYETVSNSIEGVNRIVFDELDSFKNFDKSNSMKDKYYKKQKNINSDMFWFVSATIESTKGIVFRNSNIFPDDNNSCVFEEGVVFFKNDVKAENIKVENKLLSLFYDDLDYSLKQEITRCLDNKTIKKILLDFVEGMESSISKQVFDLKESSEEYKNFVKKSFYDTTLFKKTITSMHNKTFCFKCQLNKETKCLLEFIKNFQSDSQMKKDKLREFVLSEKNKKNILVSDSDSCIYQIEDILIREKVKYTELKGGTVEDMNKDIESYITGDVNFLILNSNHQSSGMNLQITDNIIILHSIPEEQEIQIAGRADRPGRNSKLRILKILYSL